MTEGPILVTGATGGVGRAVVDQLRRAGRPVLAGSRNPGRHHFRDGAEPVALDLEAEATIASATVGVAAIIAAHGGDSSLGPERFERIDFRGTANLLAATAPDTPFLFVSSIYTERPEPPLVEPGDPFRWKREAERAIRSSGLPYVIVRPSWLTDGPGGVRGVRFEQGDRGDGEIPRQDVAAVLVAALRSPGAFGRTFEIYASEEPPIRDWAAAFATLAPDE